MIDEYATGIKGPPPTQEDQSRGLKKITKLTKKVLKTPAGKSFLNVVKNVGLNAGIFAGHRFLQGLPIALDALGQTFLGIGDNLPVVKFDVQECEEGQAPKKKTDSFSDTRLSPPPFGATVMVAGLRDSYKLSPVVQPTPGPAPVFEPEKLVGGIPYGDKKRCYVETMSQGSSGEVGQDRCAELLDKPAEQNIRNFTNVFISKVNANVTPQY